MEDLIVRVMNVRNEAQLLHWRTKSYAQHKASDEFLEEIQKKLDEFAEVLQGMLARRLDFSLWYLPRCRYLARYTQSVSTLIFLFHSAL